MKFLFRTWLLVLINPVLLLSLYYIEFNLHGIRNAHIIFYTLFGFLLPSVCLLSKPAMNKKNISLFLLTIFCFFLFDIVRMYKVNAFTYRGFIFSDEFIHKKFIKFNDIQDISQIENVYTLNHLDELAKNSRFVLDKSSASSYQSAMVAFDKTEDRYIRKVLYYINDKYKDIKDD